MFGRATITLGIGPHSSSYYFTLVECILLMCVMWNNLVAGDSKSHATVGPTVVVRLVHLCYDIT